MVWVHVPELSGSLPSRRKEDGTNDIPAFTWEVLLPPVTKALQDQDTLLTGWDPKSPEVRHLESAAEVAEDELEPIIP